VTRLAGAALVVLLTSTAALAQERTIANLKNVPPQRRVTSVAYCRGAYDVALADGSARTFKEYDLAFKTDASPNGPSATRPALVPIGGVSDRAFVVFADLDELTRTLKGACRH
jgi:hypothetical protein